MQDHSEHDRSAQYQANNQTLQGAVLLFDFFVNIHGNKSVQAFSFFMAFAKFGGLAFLQLEVYGYRDFLKRLSLLPRRTHLSPASSALTHWASSTTMDLPLLPTASLKLKTEE